MFLNRKYRILKKLNYFSDQRGIFERYLNEAESWNIHLEKTKNSIITAAQKTSKNSCAILGSGWLLDIPVEQLAEQFKEVYLFDIIHPSQIKHKLSKLRNIKFVEIDITGGAIQQIYDSVQMYKSYKKRKELKDFIITGFQYAKEFDFVASVNILSQLDQILINYIKNYNLYSDDELKVFSQIVQQKHLETLPEGKTCLITDVKEIILDKNDKIEHEKQILSVELPTEKIFSEWQWHFDKFNYYPNKKVVFQVVAFEL